MKCSAELGPLVDIIFSVIFLYEYLLLSLIAILFLDLEVISNFLLLPVVYILMHG